MNIKKYIKIIENNDYYGLYTILHKDYALFYEKLKQCNTDNNKLDLIYYNFVLYMWNEIKENNIYESEEIYIEKYLESKSILKYDLKEFTNIDKEIDEKTLSIRKSNFIHHKIIEELLIDDLKRKSNQDTILSEHFVDTVNGNLRYIDCYGNFGYKDTLPNYFFYIFLLSDNAIIYKPLTVRYESIPDNKEFKVIHLSKISYAESKKSSNKNIEGNIITLRSIEDKVLLTLRDLLSPNVVIFKHVLEEYLKNNHIPIEYKL